MKFPKCPLCTFLLMSLYQELISYRCSSCSSSWCCSCWGDLFQKSLRLRRFKTYRDEIWQQCSSGKIISVRIDWQSRMFDLTSSSYSFISKITERICKFQDGVPDVLSRSKVLCCHLVSENKTSVGRICSKPVSSWSVVHPYLFIHLDCKYMILSVLLRCDLRDNSIVNRTQNHPLCFSQSRDV